MARLRQALLYCLQNVSLWCQAGAGSFLSELLFQMSMRVYSLATQQGSARSRTLWPASCV
jgi:hypothetical protein